MKVVNIPVSILCVQVSWTFLQWPWASSQEVLCWSVSSWESLGQPGWRWAPPSAPSVCSSFSTSSTVTTQRWQASPSRTKGEQQENQHVSKTLSVQIHLGLVWLMPTFCSCVCVCKRAPQLSYQPDTLLSQCNMGCTCSLKHWDPVCAYNGMTYASPCLAGCQSSSGTGKEMVREHILELLILIYCR